MSIMKFISEPMAHIINFLLIAYGIVPDQIKIAPVVPLFKADDPSLFTNYRPESRFYLAFPNSWRESSTIAYLII